MQLKRNSYVVCDPCYVMLDEHYEALIADGIVDGVYEIAGNQVWAHHTAYGDGYYSSNSSLKFPVDSGMIGAVPLELCNMEEVNRLVADKHASIFTDEVLYVSYYNGMFTFADETSELVIFTADEDSDEDDEDYFD
ncbi:Uncharacterised protein [Acinetobacter phage MD-2021a]|nr:Uncharacterised protein [Acinetobacter phage MD-2021a]CAH1068843.1 Uncharacterised protein [Acinetobacter phage MD-2021a]